MALNCFPVFLPGPFDLIAVRLLFTVVGSSVDLCFCRSSVELLGFAACDELPCFVSTDH